MAPKRVESVTISFGGKGESVRRKHESGMVEDICECWYNIDVSRGCIAQVIGDLMPEVIENQGTYAPGNFQKYKGQGIIGNFCDYCYSFGNRGNVFSRMVNGKLT